MANCGLCGVEMEEHAYTVLIPGLDCVFHSIECALEAGRHTRPKQAADAADKLYEAAETLAAELLEQARATTADPDNDRP
jgi:hypothetical protein